jgi:uncharacterized protein (TIGR02453 family)
MSDVKRSLGKAAPKAEEAKAYFGPEGLKFLRGLKRNNDREWFAERKQVYERELKAPMIAVARQVTDAMLEFAPEHVRPAEKCVMRIYRDTRFSADKSPYKTQVAAWWSRVGLEKTSGGGFYFHVSPTEVTIAAGVYMPAAEQLKKIRLWLVEHHGELRALLEDKKLRKKFALFDGQALTRPPKGFDKDEPGIDLIRQKQWGVSAELPVEAALEPDFARVVAEHFRLAAPLVEALNRPLVVGAGKRKALF